VKGNELSESKVNIKSSDKFGVITIFEGKYITGGSTGEITIWDLMNIKNSNLTHNKAVDSLCVRGEKYIFFKLASFQQEEMDLFVSLTET
jgi:hypothetical protein